MIVDNLKISWEYADDEGGTYKKITICKIEDVNIKVLLETGTSYCSYEDQFEKEKGRKISLKRALLKLTSNKDLRRKIWEAYLNRKS